MAEQVRWVGRQTGDAVDIVRVDSWVHGWTGRQVDR